MLYQYYYFALIILKSQTFNFLLENTYGFTYNIKLYNSL